MKMLSCSHVSQVVGISFERDNIYVLLKKTFISLPRKAETTTVLCLVLTFTVWTPTVSAFQHAVCIRPL